MDTNNTVLNWLVGLSVIGILLFIFGTMFSAFYDSSPYTLNRSNSSQLISGNIVNSSVAAAGQLESIGTILGVLLLVGVAVLMILLLYTVVRRLSGRGR